MKRTRNNTRTHNKNGMRRPVDFQEYQRYEIWLKYRKRLEAYCELLKLHPEYHWVLIDEIDRYKRLIMALTIPAGFTDWQQVHAQMQIWTAGLKDDPSIEDLLK